MLPSISDLYPSGYYAYESEIYDPEECFTFEEKEELSSSDDIPF